MTLTFARECWEFYKIIFEASMEFFFPVVLRPDSDSWTHLTGFAITH